MRAGKAGLAWIVGERIPAAMVACATNFQPMYAVMHAVMYAATVVRESVDRDERDADERCGRKAEDHVARHDHLLVGLRHDPCSHTVPVFNNFSRRTFLTGPQR